MMEFIVLGTILVFALAALAKMYFGFSRKTDRELRELKRERERLKESLEMFRNKQS